MDWLCCFWDLCWNQSHFPIEDLFSQTLSRTFDTILPVMYSPLGIPGDLSISIHFLWVRLKTQFAGSTRATVIHFGIHGQEKKKKVKKRMSAYGIHSTDTSPLSILHSLLPKSVAFLTQCITVRKQGICGFDSCHSCCRCQRWSHPQSISATDMFTTTHT